MLSDLTAVSTYGWYSSSGSADSLTAISTFGWYGTGVTPVGFAVAFAGAGFIQRADFGVAGP